MDNKKETLLELGEAVIKICPACGVVNPAGPSEECPHFQLVRFDGVPESLESLLGEVASARRIYTELISKLKDEVKVAARDGIGEVETPRKVRSSEVEKLYGESSKVSPLNLTHPEKPKIPLEKKRQPPKKRKTGPPAVDSRQLDLIAQSPAKGDA